MDLNQFSTVDIVLDKANDNFIQKQTISAGDRNGRSLTLQVTDAGSIGEVAGLTANLLWTNHSSGLSDLSAFSVVDRTTSLFKIEYPQNMLTAGKVTAQIQLLHNGKVTHSKKFEIIVLDIAGKLKGVLQTAEYTALVEALAKTNEFETEIAKKADKTQVDALGSEIIVARGGATTLGERLDGEKDEIAARLRQTMTQTEFDSWVATLLDGGPSIFFDTYSQLITTYPNGSAGVALIRETDPAKIYAWNGSAWEDFGDYQGLKLKKNAVKPSNISESTWKAFDFQTTAKSIEESYPSDVLLDFKPIGSHDVSEDVVTSNLGITEVNVGGYYFIGQQVGFSLKTGEVINLAIKMLVDSEESKKEVEFLNGSASIFKEDMSYMGDGWYIYENLKILENATMVRIRIDNRPSLNPSKKVVFKFPLIRRGNTLNVEYYSKKTDFESLEKQTELLKQKQDKSPLKRLLPYQTPAGFRWTNSPVANCLYTDYEGNFKVLGFDIKKYIPTGKAYYVDKINGSDANDGKSLKTAFQSLTKAYNMSDVAIIYLAEGDYGRNKSDSLWEVAINKNIALIGLPNHVVNYVAHSPSVFTKVQEYNNVYSASRGALGLFVLDKKYKQGMDYFELTKRETILEVEENAGSYAYLGGFLYIHTLDSRVPDNDLLISAPGIMFSATGGMDVYVENINFIGGDSPMKVRNTPSALNPRVFGKDCTFLYSGGSGYDGIMLEGVSLSIFENCRVGKSKKDGFNYHALNGIIPKSIEIDCVGFENGVLGSLSNQGSTTHDGGSIIRINGAYYKNHGGNLTEDATNASQNTQSLNLGCVSFESLANRADANVNFYVYDNVEMWLDGCIAYGSNTNLSKQKNGHLKVRNSRFTGKIIPDNQLFDFY